MSVEEVKQEEVTEEVAAPAEEKKEEVAAPAPAPCRSSPPTVQTVPAARRTTTHTMRGRRGRHILASAMEF